MDKKTKSKLNLKFLKILYENAENGIVSNPSRFWEKSGYKTRNSALSIITYLAKRGLLEKIPGKMAVYKLLYSFSEERLTVTVKSNQAEIPAPPKDAETANGLGVWIIRGKVTKKFLEILSSNAEFGIINYPAKYWKDSGFQYRNSCQGTIGYLTKIGFLQKIKGRRATYKLLYNATQDGIVRISAEELYPDESSLCKAEEENDGILLLTAHEKIVFDELGDPDAVASIQLKPDQPPELRINDLKPPLNLLETDEKDRLIAKLCSKKILAFAGITNAYNGSGSSRTRIYRFDRKAYDEYSQKIQIMSDLEELIEDYSDQLCRSKNSLKALDENKKNAQAEHSRISAAEKELAKEMEELSIRLKQYSLRKSELEKQLGEFTEKLNERELSEKIADLENTILVLNALTKLPKGRRVALAKKIFPGE
jgi:hypothetical protein